MRIQSSLIANPTVGANELAEQVAIALRQEHTERPFANALRLSEWLHANYGNPRLSITTNEDGNTLIMAIRPNNLDLDADEPILRISCSL